MNGDARATDALYVTNKALARIEGLVAVGDVELAIATIARRAMEALLSDADAVWQARDNVRQSVCNAEETEDRLVLPPLSAMHPQAAAAAPMGFHEPEAPVVKRKSRRGAGKITKRAPR